MDGVNEDGVLAGSLQLRRIYGTAGQAEGGDVRGGSVEIPIWVELSRRFVLGPQWTIESTLRRVSSASAPNPRTAIASSAWKPGALTVGFAGWCGA